MSKDRVISIGTAYLDIDIFEVPFGRSGTAPNTGVLFGKEYETSPGGSASKFATVGKSMGLATIFIGKVGNDDHGQLLKGKHVESGVVPALVISSKVQTNIAVHLHNGQETIMVGAGNANQSLTKEEIVRELAPNLNQVDFIYFGGVFAIRSMSIDDYIDLAQKARDQGVKVILDHGRINNRITPEIIQKIQELVAFVDFYLPSRDEFLYVWNSEDIYQGLTKIREKSEATVAVKDSDQGAVGMRGSTIAQVPAFKVPVINHIGAGDSFNVGFIKAVTEGLSLEECIIYGNATAAVKVSQRHLPTPQIVARLILQCGLPDVSYL